MTEIRRAHYGAVVGVALVVGALVVTLAGAWPDVQSVLGAVMPILAGLLVLKALSVVVTIGLQSVR